MPTDGSNTGTRPPTASNTTEADRFTTESVDGTPATVVRRQTEASDAFDAITTVLDRTPDVELDPDPTVQSLAHAEETVGYRITYETTSERATDVVATRFDDDEDDEPLVSIGIEGGDGGPVRYYYRANADTVDGDDRNVSVQREPLAPYTSDEPTVDGPVPLPKTVTARLRLVEDENPKVGETAAVTARESSTRWTDDTDAETEEPARIVKYEWDLNEDGSFEITPEEGGNMSGSTIEVPRYGTYHDPQTELVRVRVSDSNGNTDVADLEFEVLTDDPPKAVITEKEAPDRKIRDTPGARMFSAEETTNIEKATALEWNFAFEGGRNSGKVDGSPGDSTVVVERPENGWTQLDLEKIYNYQITGTYTVRLKTVGERTTTTAEKRVEVPNTRFDQFKGELVRDPRTDEDAKAGTRYTVKNPKALTPDGWQPYDTSSSEFGVYKWIKNGSFEGFSNSNSYTIKENPYEEIELEVELEYGDRSGRISTSIPRTDNPLRTNINVSGAEGETRTYEHFTEMWNDGTWEAVTPDRFRWLDQNGEVISTEPVVDGYQPGLKLEVFYDNLTATDTHNYDNSSELRFDKVDPKIELHLQPDVDDLIDDNDVEGEDPSLRAIGEDLTYLDGVPLVSPTEQVTITAERSIIPDDVTVNEYHWRQFREVQNETTVQYVTSFQGQEIQPSLKAPNRTVSITGAQNRPAKGREYLVLGLETDDTVYKESTTILVREDDTTQAVTAPGYEPAATGRDQSTRLPLLRDGSNPAVDGQLEARATDGEYPLRLRDDAHPGRTRVWRPR